MSKAKFTPGPWRLSTLTGARWKEVFGGTPEEDVAQAVGTANAHLIAAAPEMYQLLEDVRDHGTYAGSTREADINAALARARGEEVKP